MMMMVMVMAVIMMMVMVLVMIMMTGSPKPENAYIWDCIEVIPGKTEARLPLQIVFRAPS